MPEPTANPEPIPWLLPGALLVASLTASVWLGLPPPKPGEPLAAMFPPWWSRTDALAAAVEAGGAIVRIGPSSLVVAHASAPDFEARLHAAGAWILFDPRGLGLCTTPDRRS